jgi:hypothetical protein
VLVIVFMAERYDLDILAEQFVMENVFTVALVGILTTVAMWLWLGREGLARKYVSVLWVGYMHAFNSERLKRHETARVRAIQKSWDKHPKPWVENWFLSRMESCDYSGPGRYYWGALYSTFALAVSRWYNLVLLVFMITIMFGYIGQGFLMALIMLPVLAVMGRQSTIYSTMLISGGRRRKFTTTWWLVVTDSALLCAGTLTVSGLSLVLVRFMPAFTIEGHTLRFLSIDPRVVFVPLVFLPFASAMRLIFRGKPFLLFGSLILPVLVGEYWSLGGEEPLGRWDVLLLVISIMVVSWGVFLLVLHRVCSKWCLVGGGRAR